MYKINVIAVGNLKEDYFIAAAEEYKKRIGGFCKLEVYELDQYKLTDESSSSIRKALSEEGKNILKKAGSGRIILLDIAGRETSSEQFSSLMTSELDKGEVNFVIGSSYGVSDEVRKAANLRISLGRITLPHRLARIVLLEQIYRGFTIAGGRSYHK